MELPKWSQVTAKTGVRWNLYIKYNLYISLSLISCSVSAVSLEKVKSVHVFSLYQSLHGDVSGLLGFSLAHLINLPSILSIASPLGYLTAMLLGKKSISLEAIVPA